MNPGFPRQFPSWMIRGVCLGVLILFCPIRLISAEPQSKAARREAENIVAEANRLAKTQAAEDYLKQCATYFSPAVGRTFDKEHVPPEKPMLLQIIAVVRADGHIGRILAVNNAFSIRFRQELKGTVLPKPPRDRWPMFLNTALVYHLNKDQ